MELRRNPAEGASPFYLYKFKDKGFEYPNLFHKVFSVAEQEHPWKMFGLSLYDLLQMDYDTFLMFDQEMLRVVKEKMKSLPDGADDESLDKLMASMSKGKKKKRKP